MKLVQLYIGIEWLENEKTDLNFELLQNYICCVQSHGKKITFVGHMEYICCVHGTQVQGEGVPINNLVYATYGLGSAIYSRVSHGT